MSSPDELDTLDVPALKELATSLGCEFSPNPRRSSLYGLIRSKREYDAATERRLRDTWLPPPDHERSDLRCLAGTALALIACGHRTKVGRVTDRPGCVGYARADDGKEPAEDRLFATLSGLIAEVGAEQTARMINAECKVPFGTRDSEPCHLAARMIAEWVGLQDAALSYGTLIAPRLPADARYSLMRSTFDSAEAFHSRRETVDTLEVVTRALRDAPENKLSADDLDMRMLRAGLSRVELERLRVEVAELRAQLQKAKT